jgi:hypothetical protein
VKLAPLSKFNSAFGSLDEAAESLDHRKNLVERCVCCACRLRTNHHPQHIGAHLHPMICGVGCEKDHWLCHSCRANHVPGGFLCENIHLEDADSSPVVSLLPCAVMFNAPLVSSTQGIPRHPSTPSFPSGSGCAQAVANSHALIGNI